MKTARKDFKSSTIKLTFKVGNKVIVYTVNVRLPLKAIEVLLSFR